MNLSGKETRVDKEGLAFCYTEMGLKTFSLLQSQLLYESRNPTTMGEEFTKDCSFAIREFRVS
jgi:hypothetical protein